MLRTDGNNGQQDLGVVNSPVAIHKERIVLLTGRQAKYECLSHAIQSSKPQFEVSLLDHLSSPGAPDPLVRMVLIAPPMLETVNCIHECRTRFPNAAICLLVEEGAGQLERSIVEDRMVEGVLRLSLPLDVCLAVLSLLLSGGEYLSLDHHETRLVPPEAAARFDTSLKAALQRGLVSKANEAGGRNTEVGSTGTAKTEPTAQGIEVLTSREREILLLISEGYQNKLIANRMSLSEHTVKAHVHNLIAKLRVTNRTQAAAFLHQRRQMHVAEHGLRGNAPTSAC